VIAREADVGEVCYHHYTVTFDPNEAARAGDDERVRPATTLSPAERAFVERCEPLWRRAHEIAARNPGLDPSDIFHVLFTWHDTPSQRLKHALERVRPRTQRG
jgi:hypothetical protein